MEYIGNRPNPYPDDPTYRWWLDPNWIYGGMNPPPFSPEGAGEPGGGRGGGGGQQAPTQPNEGQTTETPEGTDPAQFAPGTGNPVFKTETIGNQPAPLETLPTEFGNLDPGLAEYLATLPVHEGGGTGGGGGDYKTYFTDPSGGGGGGGNTNTYWDFPDTGGSGDTKTYFTDPPAEERGNTYTYFSDPSFGDPTKGNTYTYFTDPSAKDYYTYFAPVPTRPPINGPVNPPTELPPLEFPPIRTNPQQPQQQQPIGQALAALPMLAAFQGGTTTTPAPYAHLGPHTPVAPVFKPQGRGNPIPSIGQLLAGVK